jgi:hypothetical protein
MRRHHWQPFPVSAAEKQHDRAVKAAKGIFKSNYLNKI